MKVLIAARGQRQDFRLDFGERVGAQQYVDDRLAARPDTAVLSMCSATFESSPQVVRCRPTNGGRRAAAPALR
jgi:hypothetical protein